ncbi:MAG: GDP-mannose mannosyl hydrolase [Candidatus Saccharibacteria bacterium]|nr:GDP-mannose mannosyl hydrolase [Candidatus Saccharibacteria bacterium]
MSELLLPRYPDFVAEARPNPITSPKITHCVKVLLLNRYNEALLIRRADNDPNRPGTWDLPGGGKDLGETVWQTGGRELGEETGIFVPPYELHRAKDFTYMAKDGRRNDRTIMLYRADIGRVEPVLSHEHQDAKWESFAEAVPMIGHGAIRAAIANIDFSCFPIGDNVTLLRSPAELAFDPTAYGLTERRHDADVLQMQQPYLPAAA